METELLVETAREIEAALDEGAIGRLRARVDGPLAVVAAGSSLAGAALWAWLHASSGRPAWTMSPYALAEQGVPPGTRVLVLSSGGGHHDVLRAARRAVAEGWALSVVTCAKEAPLVRIAREAGGDEAALVVQGAPRADGLLPVHGLAPLLVLAARMYAGAGPWAPRFVATPAVVPARRPRFVAALGVGAAGPAAQDFASRVRESGLAPAWCSDLRDFSHGSFITLADARDEGLLVAFAAGPQRGYLTRWAARLPAGVGLVRVEVEEDGAGAALELLARGMGTFEALAGPCGVSVGLERIPPWGRGIYGLEV